jgi:superfamily I DNA/RNA helicase
MTFHAFGLSLLREHAAVAGLPEGFRVLDEAARQALVKQVAERMDADGDASKLASAISRAKAPTTALSPRASCARRATASTCKQPGHGDDWLN